jgi:hypothetical protein
MLFLSFADDRIEVFKGQFYEAAKQYGANNISFLIGDITVAQGAFQVFFRNLLLWPATCYNLLTCRTAFFGANSAVLWAKGEWRSSHIHKSTRREIY